MNRAARCRNAAATATSIAARHLAGFSPAAARLYREALSKLEDDIADVLYQSFAGPVEGVVDDLLDEARRHEMNERITGYDPKEDDPDYRSPADRLEKTMKDGLTELDELTNHVCKFSEDSPDLSCPTCGTSGLI